MPVLFENNVDFKIPSSVDNIIRINSGVFGETAIGKIITVYTQNCTELPTLVSELCKVWPSSKGPVITTDLQVSGSTSVYLRYGAYGSGPYIVNSDGRHYFALVTPSGQFVADERKLKGEQPDWAMPPPVPCLKPKIEFASRLLQFGTSRYQILTSIHKTPKSRIFLAINLNNAQLAIIKCARIGVGTSYDGLDAVTRLRHESAVYNELSGQNAGYPRASFERVDDNAAVLVLPDLAETALSDLRRDEQLVLLSDLALALDAFHKAGFVHRDVKLANALYSRSKVRLCDFELSCKIGSPILTEAGTITYRPPEELGIVALPSYDVYALGICLAHVLLGCDPARLQLKVGQIISLLYTVGKGTLIPLFRSLCHNDPRLRPNVTDVATIFRSLSLQRLEDVDTRRSIRKDKVGKNDRWAWRAISDAVSGLDKFAIETEKGIGWRNNHIFSPFSCEGINIGATGILIGLMSIRHAAKMKKLDQTILKTARMLATSSCKHRLASGLFTGHAGVALGLAIAGRLTGDRNLLISSRRRLFHAVEHNQSEDLFSGAAGVLMAASLMAELLDVEWPLVDTKPLVGRVVMSLSSLMSNLSGSSKARPIRTQDARHLPLNSIGIGAAHGVAGIALGATLWGRLMNNAGLVDLARNSLLEGLHRTILMTETYPSDPDSVRNKGRVDLSWCHGLMGMLWCVLQTFYTEPMAKKFIYWAVSLAGKEPGVEDSTYCHGVSGHLEVWRMLARHSDFEAFATIEAEKDVQILRCLQAKRMNQRVWRSDNPEIFTPDLWVGFLGPATSLSLWLVKSKDSLLSVRWLKRISQ